MGAFLQVIEIVAPVFLLAAVGWVWVRLGKGFDIEFVTRLAMTVSVPCLIFVAMVRADIDPRVFRDIALATLCAYGATAAVSALAVRALRLSTRTYLAPIIFGNTGNIGLPVALFAYGQTGFGYAITIFAVMAIINFTVGVVLVAGAGDPSEALRQPVSWGAALGALFAVTGWSLPDWAMNTLSLTGQIAIPTMLITLGVAIARLHIGDARLPLGLSAFKLAVTAAAGVGAAWAFGLTGPAFGALVLQMIMPVAVTSYMLSEKYRAEPEKVAGLVVVSTLLSVAAIPTALTLLL